MRRGKEMIGKKIVALNGEVHGDHVRDLIFDAAGQRLLGLLVDEAGWFHTARVIPFGRVTSIGEDAVMVTDLNAVVPADTVPGFAEVLADNQRLTGTTLTTTEGDDLGTLADLYFDEQTGQVTGYDVSGGIFSDMSSGRSFVPASADFRLGQDVALVSPELARQLEEQPPGGLKGFANNVSESVQQRAGDLADSVKDRQKAFVMGKTVATDVSTEDGRILIRSGEPVTAETAEEAERLGLLGSLTAAAGGGLLQEFYNTAKENVQESYENISTATKERQQAFVIGKVAGNDVIAEDGSSVVRKGEVITEAQASEAERRGALGSLVASAGAGAVQQGVQQVRTGQAQQETSATVDDTLGRRVRTDVRGPSGSLIAPAGQIVTQAVIDRAKALNKEQELLSAVQLKTTPAPRLGRSGSHAASQVSAGLQSAQETSANLFDRARQWVDKTQERAAEAAEERRIELAVGRPANRVVLDRNDTIILNVGEIITHKAVEQARDSDVLGILLSSVSTDTPSIDPMSVRPDEHGRAALESQPELKTPAPEKSDTP